MVLPRVATDTPRNPHSTENQGAHPAKGCAPFLHDDVCPRAKPGPDIYRFPTRTGISTFSPSRYTVKITSWPGRTFRTR